MDTRTDPERPSTRPRANWLRLARTWHLYLGIAFAPLILFFAFSGALQVLGLQDENRDTGQEPPAWIQVLASVHKHQRIVVRLPESSSPAGESGAGPVGADAGRDGGHQGRRSRSLLFKGLVLAMSASLVFSTLLGLFIGLWQSRGRWLVPSLLAAGIVVPVLLLML